MGTPQANETNESLGCSAKGFGVHRAGRGKTMEDLRMEMIHTSVLSGNRICSGNCNK
jgi:hypothetical protein